MIGPGIVLLNVDSFWGAQSVAPKVLLGGSSLIFVAFFFALVKRTAVEDAMMKKEFGKEWDNWAEKVRYRMIPYVF